MPTQTRINPREIKIIKSFKHLNYLKMPRPLFWPITNQTCHQKPKSTSWDSPFKAKDIFAILYLFEIAQCSAPTRGPARDLNTWPTLHQAGTLTINLAAPHPLRSKVRVVGWHMQKIAYLRQLSSKKQLTCFIYKSVKVKKASKQQEQWRISWWRCVGCRELDVAKLSVCPLARLAAHSSTAPFNKKITVYYLHSKRKNTVTCLSYYFLYLMSEIWRHLQTKNLHINTFYEFWPVPWIRVCKYPDNLDASGSGSTTLSWTTK
jgi:hypothetical protein